MTRSKSKIPIAILCADIHLRDTTPICRIDDYFESQQKKIDYIRELQDFIGVPIFCAGDLFHTAKSSPFLESWVIKNIPQNFYTIAGQHDLVNHRKELFNHSSIGVLNSSGSIIYLMRGMEGWVGINCNKEISLFPDNTISDNLPIIRILLLHTFIRKPKDLQDKQIGGYPARKVLQDNPDFDIIVTGDNHKPFIVEYENRKLINCGSMMRMKTDQIDHKPRVYILYNDLSVEEEYLPIKDNVIDDSHIQFVQERDYKMEEFVKRANSNFELGLDYKENIKAYFRNNKENDNVQNIVWRSMNE